MSRIAEETLFRGGLYGFPISLLSSLNGCAQVLCLVAHLFLAPVDCLRGGIAQIFGTALGVVGLVSEELLGLLPGSWCEQHRGCSPDPNADSQIAKFFGSHDTD